MNAITQSLLAGAALGALITAPVMAVPAHPAMIITALHMGKQANKTNVRSPCTTSTHYKCDYTYSVYTTQSASAPRKTHLYATFYKWNSAPNGAWTLCSNPKQRLKVPKRSKYARIDGGTETYSYGCPSGPTTFYGDLWTNKTGVAGNVDTFVSSLKGKVKGPYQTYKVSLD